MMKERKLSITASVSFSCLEMGLSFMPEFEFGAEFLKMSDSNMCWNCLLNVFFLFIDY